MALSTRRALITSGAAFGVSALVAPPYAIRQAVAQGTAPGDALPSLQVGRFAVTALSDGFLAPLPSVQPDMSPEELRRLFEAEAANPDDYEVPVNAYLVQSPGGTILIDTGGALPGFDTLGHLAANLRAIGVAPVDIDTVLLTHLHVDHIGGLVGPDGQATFSNADIVLADPEYAYWHDDAVLAAASQEQQGLVQLARTAVGAYGARVTRIEGEIEVVPGITSVPLQGHTPGHCGFLIADGDDRLLIWGDTVQVQPLQFAHPDLYVFEVDPEAAIATRRAIMDRAAVEDLVVAGMHHLFPGFGRVRRQGEAFAYEPLEDD